jgi:hypothetical protein
MNTFDLKEFFKSRKENFDTLILILERSIRFGKSDHKNYNVKYVTLNRENIPSYTFENCIRLYYIYNCKTETIKLSKARYEKKSEEISKIFDSKCTRNLETFYGKKIINDVTQLLPPYYIQNPIKSIQYNLYNEKIRVEEKFKYIECPYERKLLMCLAREYDEDSLLNDNILCWDMFNILIKY